jgi:hypothetical protein
MGPGGLWIPVDLLLAANRWQYLYRKFLCPVDPPHSFRFLSLAMTRAAQVGTCKGKGMACRKASVFTDDKRLVQHSIRTRQRS